MRAGGGTHTCVCVCVCVTLVVCVLPSMLPHCTFTPHHRFFPLSCNAPCTAIISGQIRHILTFPRGFGKAQITDTYTNTYACILLGHDLSRLPDD